MVYLHRIYTKTGDQGTTFLGNGTSVSKTSPRVRAMGSVDEVNALMGLAICSCESQAWRAQLLLIQNDLFDLGADLCVPQVELETVSEGEESAYQPLRIDVDKIEDLEAWMDQMTPNQQPLHSFVLPGGTEFVARLHLARAVCRRAELDVWNLMETETISPVIGRYLNRLADFLFVLAREANQQGAGDVLWKPLAGRAKSS